MKMDVLKIMRKSDGMFAKVFGWGFSGKTVEWTRAEERATTFDARGEFVQKVTKALRHSGMELIMVMGTI